MADQSESLLVGRLGANFAELGQLLSAGAAGSLGPERIVAVASRVVEHGDDCGLTLVPAKRRPVTAAAAGEFARRVDAVQFVTGEGPCLDASAAGDRAGTDQDTGQAGSDYVYADDLRADPRWPAFGPRCVSETGVRSILSIRVPLADDDRAALNFYSTTPAAFDELDVGVGAILAPFAALAVQAARHQQQAEDLLVALHSSRQIGTAVGILMARDLITADEAFARLSTASQHLNRKIRDLADEVMDTGILPDAPDRRGRAGR